MGTDMRGYLECCRSGRWYSMDDGWDLARDYCMYRLLADVRGDGALYPPRGVPRDAGRDVRRAYYRSASWLTTAEFRQVVDYYEAHGHEFLEEDRAWHLLHPAASAEGDAYQRKVIARLSAAVRCGGWPRAAWRTMLATMEWVVARGYPVRLVFWFAGQHPLACLPSVAVVGVTISPATGVAVSS